MSSDTGRSVIAKFGGLGRRFWHGTGHPVLLNREDVSMKLSIPSPPPGYIILQPEYYPLEVEKNLCYSRLIFNQSDGQYLYEVVSAERPRDYDEFVNLLFEKYASVEWTKDSIKDMPSLLAKWSSR